MSNTYWIVSPKVTSSIPKVVTFPKWLLAEAAEDVHRLKTLASRKMSGSTAVGRHAVEPKPSKTQSRA
jgi:hypothetical protein